MKNTGKEKITGLILKAALITLLLFLITQSYAQEISPEIVTTTLPRAAPDIIELIERFYEISERSLEIGYNATLTEDSAFKIVAGSRDRYIVVNNLSKDSINLVFIGKGETLYNEELEVGDYVIFSIEDLNLKFDLFGTSEEAAEVGLVLFKKEVPADADYFELFDIQVRLAEYEIYDPTELSALIEFTNFGEGPSHVRLIYSITDENGKEYYTGVDEKIVETDEIMVKNFDTLKIPNGQYTITTTIYYGKDQEATSQETFILRSVPKYKLLKQPAIFISIVLVAFALVIFFKKKEGTMTVSEEE